MDFSAALLRYCETAVTPAWLDFNRALALELAAGLPEPEIAQLFQRIGQRVADAAPLPRCEDLAQLQDAFNAHWSSLGWGFASLEEQPDALRIVHACSPLARQFGPAASPAWAAAFFEGVYGRWFQSQGLPPTLHVRALPAQQDAAPPSPLIELRLGRSAA